MKIKLVESCNDQAMKFHFSQIAYWHCASSALSFAQIGPTPWYVRSSLIPRASIMIILRFKCLTLPPPHLQKNRRSSRSLFNHPYVHACHACLSCIWEWATKATVLMKMRIAARMRQVHEEKKLIIYRRSASVPSESVIRSIDFGHSRLKKSICEPLNAIMIPVRLTNDSLSFGSVLQYLRRQPEHTVMESVKMLVPTRLDDWSVFRSFQLYSSTISTCADELFCQ